MIALDTNVVVRRASSSMRTATLPGLGNAKPSSRKLCQVYV
jgi:hypothetical protein